MRSFWSEPFLWIHLAGLFAFPVFLEIVWLALSIGDPLPFFWLELIIIAFCGIVPIFWMQWHRPFDIFSILIVALQPQTMSENQRKILNLFRTPKQRWLSAIGAIIMSVILWQLYRFAPLASGIVTFIPQSRFLALGIAILAFLSSNLFLQIPLSVLGILFVSEEKFTATEPLPVDEVSRYFTIPGFRVL